MSVADEVVELLANAFGAAPGKNAITGRVVDRIGAPLTGATVQLVVTGMFSGKALASATTDAKGQFELDGSACPAEYVLVVTSGGTSRATPDTRRPPLKLGDIQLMLPLSLTSTVGDGADNYPYDLRRVQDRLQRSRPARVSWRPSRGIAPHASGGRCRRCAPAA
jgi:hypothetical protein